MKCVVWKDMSIYMWWQIYVEGEASGCIKMYVLKSVDLAGMHAGLFSPPRSNFCIFLQSEYSMFGPCVILCTSTSISHFIYTIYMELCANIHVERE